MTIVTMTKEELRKAAAWGDARTLENLGTLDIPDYDQNRFNLTPQQNNRMGVLAEFAVYKWAGFDTENIDTNIWVPFVHKAEYARIKTPDIAGVLEVRRANKESSPIPVRTKDVRAGAVVIQPYIKYVQEERFGPIRVNEHVELLGWVPAQRAWDFSATANYSAGDTRSAFKKYEMEDLNLKEWLTNG